MDTNNPISLKSSHTFTGLIGEMKPYFMNLFHSATHKTHNDIRELVKLMKSNGEAKIELTNFLSVTRDIVDSGLDALHELFIIDAHTVQYSKQQLTIHISNVSVMIKQYDSRCATDILLIWKALDDDLFSVTYPVKRLVVSKQYRIHSKDVSSKKLQDVISSFIKNDSVVVLDDNTIKLVTSDPKAMSRLAESDQKIGPFAIHVEQEYSSTSPKVQIGPIMSSNEREDIVKTLELYSAVTISSSIIVKNDLTYCIIELGTNNTDIIPPEIEIFSQKYTCQKLLTSGINYYLYGKTNGGSKVITSDLVFNAFRASYDITLDSIPQSYWWGFVITTSSKIKENMLIMIVGNPFIIAPECSHRVIIEELPHYLLNETELTRQIKVCLNGITPISQYITSDKSVVMHFETEKPVLKLIEKGFKCSSLVDVLTQELPNQLVSGPLRLPNDKNSPKAKDKNLQTKSSTTESINNLVKHHDNFPPISSTTTDTQSPLVNSNIQSDEIIKPESCVLVQNHTNVTFGDIASTIGRKLSVRVGKIQKSIYVPGFVVIPFPNPHYVTKTIEMGHLTVQHRLPVDIKLEIRHCLGKRTYPLPSIAFLKHFCQLELSMLSDFNIKLIFEDECIKFESLTSDERNNIKIREKIDELANKMVWHTYYIGSSIITPVMWNSYKDIVQTKMDSFRLNKEHVGFIIALNPSKQFTPFIYLFAKVKEHLDKAVMIISSIQVREYTVRLNGTNLSIISQSWPIITNKLKSFNTVAVIDDSAVKPEPSLVKPEPSLVKIVSLDEQDLQKAKDYIMLECGNVSKQWDITSAIYHTLKEIPMRNIDGCDIYLDKTKIILSGNENLLKNAITTINSEWDKIFMFTYTFRIDTAFLQCFDTISNSILTKFVRSYNDVGFHIDEHQSSLKHSHNDQQYLITPIRTLRNKIENNDDDSKIISVEQNKSLVLHNITWASPNDSNVLAEALSQNTKLIELNLSGNSIGSRGVKALANTLSTHPALIVLKLAGNMLSDKRVEFIANGIAKNTQLSIINLEGIVIDSEDKLTYISNILETWPQQIFHVAPDDSIVKIPVTFYSRNKDKIDLVHSDLKQAEVLKCLSIPLDVKKFTNLTTVLKNNKTKDILSNELSDQLIKLTPVFITDRGFLIESKPDNFILHTMNDWYGDICHIQSVLSRSNIRKIFTEHDFESLYLSYFWYKRKHEMQKLKTIYQLIKCDFKKLNHASQPTNPEQDKEIPKPDHDFELLLEGTPKAILNTIQAIAAMEHTLRKVSRSCPFFRPYWELLRLRQQDFNSNPVISLNLLPNIETEEILVTAVTTVDHLQKATEFVDSFDKTKITKPKDVKPLEIKDESVFAMI